MWTKGEIRKVMNIWEDSTPEEVSKEIGVTVGQLMSLVRNLRLSGIKIAKKKKLHYLRLLIEEVKSELK